MIFNCYGRVLVSFFLTAVLRLGRLLQRERRLGISANKVEIWSSPLLLEARTAAEVSVRLLSLPWWKSTTASSTSSSNKRGVRRFLDADVEILPLAGRGGEGVQDKSFVLISAGCRVNQLLWRVLPQRRRSASL